MFLKKAAIITLSTLFLTAGCVSTPNPEQEAKITNLESALVQSKADTEQQKLALEETKANLQKANEDLQKSQKEAVELNKKLEKQAAAKKAQAKSNNVVVQQKAKNDAYLDKTVLGQAEWIYISKAKINLKARIDTGATVSSINALNIQRFERDGKKWVRFNLTESKDGKENLIEVPILRTAKIVQSSQPGKVNERPVVKLHVRIGNISHQSEFTLIDRTHMSYPVLIGRTFMQDIVLVDVSQEYIHPKYQATNKK
ncbi:ATP-dependent zinc protease [Psychromonas sp. RZ22]|uniref:ATP-dependent zinc protease family protein n=1 Tax=Psychromonas algarum TaxID=2555643 RepID=UPI0010689E2A|nr:ATP-dependent zinc protease [Psychromonas sp. RZ22]TEW56638.1 ATP-dependent zinc protease [Psychromonas sp. RZ22]